MGNLVLSASIIQFAHYSDTATSSGSASIEDSGASI